MEAWLAFVREGGEMISEGERGTGKETVPQEDICPYWHSVTSDFMWMYPAGGYCIAGCHLRIRVPARKTFKEVCAANYAECEGYLRRAEEDEVEDPEAA